MATFSRVTVLLIIAVFITYHRESEARLIARVPGTGEKMGFANMEAYMTWLGVGADMFRKTMDGICWYIQLKAIPFNNRRGYFSDCYIDFVTYKQNEQCLGSFTGGINITGQDSIPEYHSKCENLLLTPRATPKTNEASILNAEDDDYAFIAYFYCLIHQIRVMHGDKVIQIIKQERIDAKKKDWMPTIHDRLNEFRSLHAVEPLQLNDSLINDAQKRANSLAESCTWKSLASGDELTAENIYLSGIDFSDAPIFAYECVNQWYKEVKRYPFPQGVDAGTWSDKYAIRNFANVVWKGSKTVGYGYAVNPKCRREGYVVAQFYPVGEKDGEYKNNVLAPKHSE